MSAIKLDDVLFENDKVNPIILKALPKAIKDGLVKGALEKDQTFVPEAHTLQLQNAQITALEKNKIIELCQLEKVGIKKIEEFLAKNMDSSLPYTVLEEYVIVNSYASALARELETNVSRDGFVDLNGVTLFGIPSDSPDRAAIIRMALPHFYEITSDPKLESVYLQDSSKKLRKTQLPNFFVPQKFEKEIKDSLEQELAIPTAKHDALNFSENKYDFTESEEGLSEEILGKLPKLDSKTISTFLQKDFAKLHENANPIPPQLLRYYGSTYEPLIREIYEQTLIGEIRRLYNAEKLDSLVLLLVNLRGILDISSMDKKLGTKIYGDLKESLQNKSAQQSRYLSEEAATLDMTELEEYILKETERIMDSEFSLDDALLKLQERIVAGLERALKKVDSLNEGAYILHLATCIIHSKVLRADGIFGVLNISGRYTPKVLKKLGKRVDVNELHSLLEAMKKNEVTEKLVQDAKDIALNS